MSIAPPGSSPLAPGYKLDRYELICPIAEGGMASVWIARQTGKHGFQKLVAVKTILPKYAAEPRFQQMFVDEARIASRIEHANVTQILDVGEQHEVTYLVMEYVDGDALSKLHRAAKKRGAPIPPGIVLRVMADVCGGLHAAHELQGSDGKPLGVVHRDVSPQNVLVSTKGVAKLIDFGIAKARDRLAEDTNADQLKGKVQYMAPEQAVGRPVDRRADVWAVGAVLYHLLGGRPPFEADNDVQTLFLLSSGRPPPPLRMVDPRVVAVVRRALTHAPDARYPTAAALQQALEEAIVQSGLVTTTAAVGAYLAEQMGERAEKRKNAIAVGLKAAEEREKYNEIMRSNTDRTNAGSGSSAATRPPVPEASTSDETNPSSATGQTLGSAALSVREPDPRRGLRFAIVGAAVGAAGAVLLLVGILAASRKPQVAALPPRPPPAATSTVPAAATTALAAAAPPAAASASEATADPTSTPATSVAATAIAPATATPPAVRPVWTPPAVAAPKPTSTSKSTRVNDGF